MVRGQPRLHLSTAVPSSFSRPVCSPFPVTVTAPGNPGQAGGETNEMIIATESFHRDSTPGSLRFRLIRYPRSGHRLAPLLLRPMKPSADLNPNSPNPRFSPTSFF